MDRHVPKVSTFIVSAGRLEVYNAPKAPRDVPVTLWNRGKKEIMISFVGSGSGLDTDWPLPAGAICVVNPENEIHAICTDGSSTLMVGTGIDMHVDGLTSTASLSPSAMAQLVASSHSQKELLAEGLLQLKRLVRYSAEGFNAEFSDTDLADMP